MQSVEKSEQIEQLPKLRKASIPERKEESVKTESKAKPKTKTKAKPKYEELPEIPDYERPVLEKYDKPEFEAGDFTRQLNIPSKMEKPVLEAAKQESQPAKQNNEQVKVFRANNN